MIKFVLMIAMMAAAGICTPPPRHIRNGFRSVTKNVDRDAVIEIIEEGIEKIKESGLDPYINEGEEYEATIAYPFPGNLRIGGSFKNFKFTGLSNIVINSVAVSHEKQLLFLDLSLPRLEAVMEEAITEVSYDENIYGKIEYSGILAVNDIHFIAEVHPTFLGRTLDDLDITVSIGSVESNLKLVVGDTDVSSYLNKFLEFSLPELLKEYGEEINENLSKQILAIISG